MTIINIHLEQRRALVAANTQGVFPGVEGRALNASKVFAIPHANAVVAGRGPLALVFNIFAACHGLPDLDAVFRDLEPIAHARSALFREEVKRLGAAVSADAEVYLVGWSAYCQRMVCSLCRVHADGRVEVEELGNVWAPWEASWGEKPADLATDEAMARAARLQRSHVEPLHPGQGWGGGLTIAEITPESITFRSVREFWK